MSEEKARCWLYSDDCPNGQIFEGQEAIENAEAEGWVDNPAKLEKEKEPAKKPASKTKKGS